MKGKQGKEGLTRTSELLRHPLEELLDSSRVADEGGGHLEASGRDVAHGSLHVVGDPLYEVGRVLVLDVEHLLIHLCGQQGPDNDKRVWVCELFYHGLTEKCKSM